MKFFPSHLFSSAFAFVNLLNLQSFDQDKQHTYKSECGRDQSGAKGGLGNAFPQGLV